MKTYIAGPMSKIRKLNEEAFFRAEKLLLENGLEPYNLFRHPDFEDGLTPQSYRKVLCEDLRIMCEECDTIYLLKGWRDSKGCLVEYALAVALNFNILFESPED